MDSDAQDDSSAKVLFLPFTVQAPESQQYLQCGLANMLATRVADRAGIIAANQTPAAMEMVTLLKKGKQAAFGQAFEKMTTRYLAVGAMTSDEKNIELTVYVYDRLKTKEPVVFSHSVSEVAMVLSGIDELAWDIAEKIFGKKRPSAMQAEVKPVSDKLSQFQTPNPERAFRSGAYNRLLPGAEAGSVSGKSGNGYLAVGESSEIPELVQAMVSGDINGDGSQEIVLATDSRLLVYRYENNQFIQITTVELADYLTVHALNLADLTGNGIPELYVSANKGSVPASWILQWDGSGFTSMFKDVPFYIRPAEIKGVPMLLGQAGNAQEEVSPDVYRLVFGSEDKLIKTKQVSVPGSSNIFDFITADINGDGKTEVISLDQRNILQVMDWSGKRLWFSNQRYGAGRNFFGNQLTNAIDNPIKVYLSTRLIAADVNQDSRVDIIVGVNRLASFAYFDRLRYFRGSTIAALTWQGGALVPLWETQGTKNYTVDYQIISSADDSGATGEGHDTKQLCFIEDLNSHLLNFLSSPRCRIQMYQLGNPETRDK